MKWLIGSKLYLPNLNNVGDSLSSSGHRVIPNRKLRTCQPKLSLTGLHRSFASQNQFRLTAPQISDNRSMSTEAKTIPGFKSCASTEITSPCNCSILHTDSRIRGKPPLREVWSCSLAIVEGESVAGMYTLSNFSTMWQYGLLGPCRIKAVK